MKKSKLFRIISESRMKPSLKKIHTVKEFSQPQKNKNIEQFLDLAGCLDASYGISLKSLNY